MRGGGTEKLSVFSAQFGWEPKTTLQQKSIKIIKNTACTRKIKQTPKYILRKLLDFKEKGRYPLSIQGKRQVIYKNRKVRLSSDFLTVIY